ncbi:MAG: HEAT repeat domain-containing protein [Chthoniobacterales bacterium]
MVLFLLWLATLLAHGKITEHKRFDAAFKTAVWEWAQAGEQAHSLDPQERGALLAQLYSNEPPERWIAAKKLASWREPSALWPLVAAMADDAGTRRTCVISQALGKLENAAAVPALIQAAQHRSNVDLRVCATHSLGQIGDESAISFLLTRSLDRSANDGDRGVAISALGEIGSPSALPTLEEIAWSEPRPILRSLAHSAIRQIGLLEGDAETNLLGALGDNNDWIQDDWILARLHRQWSDRIAAGLNQFLREAAQRRSALRFQATALLTAKQALEASTFESLTLSSDRENHWLATLTSPEGVRLAASGL